MKHFSLALFGSSLRTDFDEYSDRDLLIVAQDYATLKSLKCEYEEMGFSVSCYTYSRLRYLSSTGSLFIQHLKCESQILLDHDNKLSIIFNSHIEVIPSKKRITESIRYFDYLKYIPDVPKGYYWFCDCFYVGLRNYLIYRSAQTGYYNFSFINLVQKLVELKEISQDECDSLKNLRKLKKDYRNKTQTIALDKNYIQEILAVGIRLQLLSSATFMETTPFMLRAKEHVSKAKTNYYKKLRLLEIYYHLSDVKVERIEKTISNPQAYASMFRDGSFVYSLLADIENEIHFKIPDLQF